MDGYMYLHTEYSVLVLQIYTTEEVSVDVIVSQDGLLAMRDKSSRR